jgi:hypothetical protein
MPNKLKEMIPFINKDKNKTEKKIKDLQLVTNSTFQTSDYFYTSNGIVGSILKLYVAPGTNRNMSFRAVLNLLPKPSKDVKLTFIVRDASIKGEEKQKIINKNTYDNIASKRAQNADATDREKDDAKAKMIQQTELDDYTDYQITASDATPLIVYDIFLIAESTSQEKIKTQIKSINTLLDKTYQGLSFYVQAGKQLDLLQSLYRDLEKTKIQKSSTGNNYALLNFAISEGLKDKTGVPIGLDTKAIVTSSTLFDFDKYTKSQAFIAIPKSSILRRYLVDDHHYTTSSYLSQAVANNIIANRPNNKIFHIVLNDFKYLNDDRYYMNDFNKDLLKEYDMTKLTINPLQGFGEYNEIQQVYERLIQKIADIFDILLDFNLETADKAIILDAIERFYFEQSLWSPEVLDYPKRARIIKVKRPDLYPTLNLFINTFTNLVTVALKDKRELKADRIDTLQSILRQALTTYQNILGKTTSIDFDLASYKQIYYTFNNVDSLAIKQVQFLNIFDFVRYISKPGDTIIIHGMDQLYQKTTDMAYNAIENAKKKGLTLLYSFDTVTAPSQKLGKMTDMFSMKELYYHDLNTDVDWSIVGNCSVDDVDKFEKVLRMSVGAQIRNQMMERSYSQVLIHRDKGHIDNFTSLDFII